MFIYLARKCAGVIPTIVGVVIVVFILFHWVGGDPTYQMLGRHASIQQIEELRHEYGFDQPTHIQLFNHLKQVITFEYGRSYATKQPIRQMILNGLGPSLSLMLPSFILNAIIAISFGLITACFQGYWADRLIVSFCILGMSVSILAYILFGQYFLAYKLGWFPISGYEEAWNERLRYLILPISIYIAVSVGYDVRFYRTAFLEEVTQDYVRTARAKGLSEFQVFFKHILKNSMIPILTNIIMEFPFLVLGSFLLESFFGIPGLGSITIDAIHNSDFPVIKAMTILVAILYIAGNLVIDLLYAWVDPRVSLK